jgi:hypothetical protein
MILPAAQGIYSYTIWVVHCIYSPSENLHRGEIDVDSRKAQNLLGLFEIENATQFKLKPLHPKKGN